MAELPAAIMSRLAEQLGDWPLLPAGTEGYRTAEVTLGGVDTDGLSSRTMESRLQPGLYFIGEVVDVTGHLGGFNFQWAWSSGHAAGSVGLDPCYYLRAVMMRRDGAATGRRLANVFFWATLRRSRINKQNTKAPMCRIPKRERGNPTRQRARQWMGGVSVPGDDGSSSGPESSGRRPVRSGRIRTLDQSIAKARPNACRRETRACIGRIMTTEDKYLDLRGLDSLRSASCEDIRAFFCRCRRSARGRARDGNAGRRNRRHADRRRPSFTVCSDAR